MSIASSGLEGLGRATETSSATAEKLIGEALQFIRDAKLPEKAHLSPEVPSEATALLSRIGIRTSDPLRTLIQLPRYGKDPAVALKMEGIIASGRDGLLRGKITSAEGLESFIANEYTNKIIGKPLKPREYEQASLMPKHSSYLSIFERRLSVSNPWNMLGEIDGKSVPFASLIREYHGNAWELPPLDGASVAKAKDRISDLFNQIGESTLRPRSSEALAATLRSVTETEWLEGQTWKYSDGSAGISSLKARTLLEFVGIDSSRFVPRDPNLDALTSHMADFVPNNPRYYQTAPRYFE